MSGTADVATPVGMPAGDAPPVPAVLFPLVILMLVALVVLKIRAARSGRTPRDPESPRRGGGGLPPRGLPADPAAALASLKAPKGGDVDG